MQECKKIRILKDTTFHQKKQMPPKNQNYTYAAKYFYKSGSQ